MCTELDSHIILCQILQLSGVYIACKTEAFPRLQDLSEAVFYLSGAFAEIGGLLINLLGKC
jgi:hypothetical protein